MHHVFQTRVFLFDWVAASVSGHLWTNIPIDFYTNLWRTAACMVGLSLVLPMAAWLLVDRCGRGRAAADRFGVHGRSTVQVTHVGVLILLMSAAGEAVSSSHRYFFEDLAVQLGFVNDASLRRVAYELGVAAAATLVSVTVQVHVNRYIERRSHRNRSPVVWMLRSVMASFWSTLGWLWLNFVSMALNNRVLDIDGLPFAATRAALVTCVWLALMRWVFATPTEDQALWTQRTLVTIRVISVDMITRSVTDAAAVTCSLYVTRALGGYALLGQLVFVLYGGLTTLLALRVFDRTGYHPSYDKYGCVVFVLCGVVADTCMPQRRGADCRRQWCAPSGWIVTVVGDRVGVCDRREWPRYLVLLLMYISSHGIGYACRDFFNVLINHVPIDHSSTCTTPV